MMHVQKVVKYSIFFINVINDKTLILVHLFMLLLCIFLYLIEMIIIFLLTNTLVVFFICVSRVI